MRKYEKEIEKRKLESKKGKCEKARREIEAIRNYEKRIEEEMK